MAPSRSEVLCALRDFMALGNASIDAVWSHAEKFAEMLCESYGLPDYGTWEELNLYGEPIIDPAHFPGMHFPAHMVEADKQAPACSCGWTRWRGPNGNYYELYDHIADMGEYGTMERPR